MSTEEINSVSVRDTLSEDTLRIIQNLSNKTQKLSALWKQVYHMTGRTHFFATNIIAEWEEGAKTEYFAGETIDFSKLHVYLHKDDEYTLEDENQIEETTSYVPSITVVPEVSEDKVVKITISYGSGSEAISTIVNITAKKVTPMPIDLDYYEGYGYSNYDGELLPKDNSTCCFTNVEFTTGVEGTMVFYPNDCTELSNVDSDCQVSVPIDIEYNSKTKSYNLPINVHYHPAVDRIYDDSNYTNNYDFIYILSSEEQTANISINRSNLYTYQYSEYYGDGKYTTTTKHGSLTYSEDGMPIEVHTRNAIISFGDDTTLEKEITIKVVNPVYKVTGPIPGWGSYKIVSDDIPVYNKLSWGSDGNVRVMYDSDNSDNRVCLNTSEYLLKIPFTKQHQISYIESSDGEITDIHGNVISVPEYKYKRDEWYYARYVGTQSDGNIVAFNGGAYMEFTEDGNCISMGNISTSKEFPNNNKVGDKISYGSIECTITRVLPERSRSHCYSYVTNEDYQVWAEENKLVIVES